MCKNKERCPNKDKCKCGTPKQVLEGVNTVVRIDHEIKSGNISYENLSWIPMTTSPRHRLNREDGCDTIEDNEEHFPINMVGVFEDEEDL